MSFPHQRQIQFVIINFIHQHMRFSVFRWKGKAKWTHKHLKLHQLAAAVVYNLDKVEEGN